MEALFNLGGLAVVVGLCLVGYVVGSYNERRHYRSILARESEMAGLLVFSGTDLPQDRAVTESQLFTGATVIAEDRFKALLAAIRNIIGGRVASYESLMDRGRREAVLRLKQKARDGGFTMVVNLRFENTRITRGIEILAYGTALKLTPRETA